MSRNYESANLWQAILLLSKLGVRKHNESIDRQAYQLSYYHDKPIHLLTLRDRPRPRHELYTQPLLADIVLFCMVSECC